MKKLLFPLAISSALLAQSFAGSFGPGPWASGAYYPGATDGKYQASVTGNNITGVIGFSVREGSPTTLSSANTAATTSTTNTADVSFTAATSAAQAFDPAQNYFLIFVDGRTYTGLASASVNVLANSVVGALLGAQPSFGYVTNDLPPVFPPTVFVTNTVIDQNGFLDVVTTNPFGLVQTNITNTITITNDAGVVISSNQVITTNIVSQTPQLITNQIPNLITNTFVDTPSTSNSVTRGTTNSFDPLPLINRGLSGGFQAQLQNKGAYMSFAGSGQLSTPSQSQSVSISTNADGSQRVGGIITETVPFLVNGLRTSFSTSLSASSQTTGN
jgi:hypothetical protein